MIVWINGAFGAGKTTLAQELCHRRPDAVLFDPELIGTALTHTVGSPTGDFQDLPSWRELVAAALVSLRGHHAELLIVPMTVVRVDYLDELLAPVLAGEEPILHVFLEVGSDELRRRLALRGDTGGGWETARIAVGVTAPTRELPGTVLLDAERLSTAQLADEVLARL